MYPSNATILIVDDELPNRALLEAMLCPEGYLTRSAANGKQALAMIEQQAPDLVLLDFMMPGMDGNEVVRILKGNPTTASIPIIMVTAQTDRAARLAGLDAGAEEFLTKPVDLAELLLRVRNLLRLKAFSDLVVSHSWDLEQQVQARTADLQRFRTAMDATADAIMLVDRSTMLFVEVNATACNMLGYTRQELFLLGPAQLMAGAAEELEAMYDAIIAGRGANSFSETHLRRKDGSFVEVEVHRQAQCFDTGWIIVCVLRDISERKAAETRLHHMAHFDALTGLPNRTLFHETLTKTLLQARESGWMVGVLFIDLDYFKNINDTLGHAVGDDLLAHFSRRLLQCVRARDVVGRLGGDEFAVIVVMPEKQQGVVQVANKIREVLSMPFDLDGNVVTLTASIGITIYPDDGSDTQTLIKYADTAMYRAKQAGRDTYRFFTAQMNVDAQARLDLEIALRMAVDRNEFLLHYQPKVDLRSGRIVAVEALLRWQRPGYGLVPPFVFVPLLEETGLIVRVGSWVIAAACRQIGLWSRSLVGPVQVSVNVSGRQFAMGNLDIEVANAIRANDIAPDMLELELTESSLMTSTERTIATLHELKRVGVHISIDDFGTGYSSLAYLRRFPIDKLKIDIAFVREVTVNPDDAAIVLAIIGMAHSLKLAVIAEGVETEAQLSYLQRHHCDQIQGFYFSEPLAAPEMEAMLRSQKCLNRPTGTAEPQRQTLLLVDDEAPILTALQRLLRQDGYHILLASSAREGLELLALHEVQVILCDQRMESMSGTEFFDRVKDLYPDTLRIVLSGYTDLESIMGAINRGAIYRFYTKPWDNQQLREHIREAFVHHRLLKGVQAAANNCA